MSASHSVLTCISAYLMHTRRSTRYAICPLCRRRSVYLCGWQSSLIMDMPFVGYLRVPDVYRKHHHTHAQPRENTDPATEK
eukprot:26946-Eustigmatos_ZCMA.PRE.1